MRSHSLTSLFGTSTAAVFDHLRSPLALPLQLHLPDGRLVYANARFSGPQAMVFKGAQTASAAQDTDPIGQRRPPARPGAVASTPTAAGPPGGPWPGPDGRGGQAAGQRLSGLAFLQTGDPQIEAVVGKVRRVLNRDIPILILGETGTGKELLARAIHQDSDRAKQAFVAVNCASIPESLIEAELFGYEEGAFTGAKRKGSHGRIVQANGGTLFLDEIGDMPASLQARLLRVLQERSVTPLGSHKVIPVDIAVIGATHRRLREMIEQGAFREDLYYRLNGLSVRMPPLRERLDLPAVAQRILLAESPQHTPEISPSVMALFMQYAWPGNVRQLTNVLRTAAVMAAGESHINESHLPDDFLEDVQRPEPAGRSGRPVAAEAAPGPGSPSAPSTPVDTPDNQAGTLQEAEIAMIQKVLDAVGGNISEASKRLGISRNTIYRKLRWNKDGA